MATGRAITFDFHNTLASCDRWFDLEIRTLAAEVLRLLGNPLSTGEVTPTAEAVITAYRTLRREVIRHGMELDAVAGTQETFRRLGIVHPDMVVASAIHELMRDCLDDLRPMPGAVDTVRALHSEGFALGIVSSAVYHPYLLWALDAFGILPLFSTVVTSASAGFYKSRPEIYRRALDDLGVDVASALHVGDSLRWDHLTPARMGIGTVLVSTEPPNLAADQPQPRLRLASLVDAAPAIAEAARRGTDGSATVP